VPAPWPRRAWFGSRGLVLEGVEASALAERFGTPLVVVDEVHFRERCRAFGSAFDRVLWAVKAFPARELMRIALQEGLGLLAATGEELEACVGAGATGDRLAIHGSNKSDVEIEAAVRAEVSLLVVDGEEELERVEAAAAGAGAAQPVLVRLAPGIDVETHAYVKTATADTRFGIPVAEGLAIRALKRALGLPHLRVRGIHLHLGSQLLSERPFLTAVDAGLDFLAEARAELGFEAEVLDVGGGMGVAYTDESPVGPAELALAIEDRLAGGCRARGLAVPQVVVEPGRAISGNAALTLYRVGAVKEVPRGPTYVAVDGGMSDNIRPALYGARYTVARASRATGAPPIPMTVVGRHCESGDVLARDVSLPSDVGRDDLLAVAATDAYEYAMASNYNRAGRPAVVLVGPGGPREILRREDAADLARLDVLPMGDTPDARPPEGVEVRPARPADAVGAFDLILSVAAERRFIRTEAPRRTVRQQRRRFRRSWDRHHADIVAVAGSQVIGHLGLGREDHPVSGHVASIGMAVARDRRGRGVGAALMAEAIRWARWAKVEKLTLTVYPHNERAIRLYRRFGFAEEGRLLGHSKKTYGYEDEVVMSRWVGPR
jgi:diaminopimelate decarboxylase